ncbi:MAG: M12 family metallopeptidase [Mariprofundaceae bacterium]|nr:M12 family metallopeptidase [Mariprofundaceae bacterium]
MSYKPNDSCGNSEEETQMHCSMPLVPERKLDENMDPNRAFLIRDNEKKWVNFTVLHYHFLESRDEWIGAESQKQAVRDAFDEWKALGIGLEFSEVPDPRDAEVRITFERGVGAWSYIGRDSIDYIGNRNERTMNFGWDVTTPYGHDTALHEIGHALGFPHEHQNPNAGIVWDEEAVYATFAQSPNRWSREKSFNNIIRKISPQAVQGSAWDKDSIMHYQFPAGIIRFPEQYRTQSLIPDTGLSPMDIEEVKKFYPPAVAEQQAELKEFLSHIIDLKSGEQLDFVIKPNQTRKYKIQTFGKLDTLLVLFEEAEDEPIYLQGDDDSGSDFNSFIEARLIRGRTYLLRLRLYFADDSGLGAVMLW